MRPRFITFEGAEGTGKSTQIARLAAWLTGRGVAVECTREPGGTPLGERTRAVLLDPVSDPVPLAELLLLEAARAQLVTTVVGPALAAGRWVLSDRFADSSVAYQAGGRGLPVELVGTLNGIACSGLAPDRTIVLELPLEVALERARKRPSTTAENSRFEDEELSFHRAVAAAYRSLAEREPHRVRLVDGTGSEEEVHGRVLAALEELLA